MAAPASPWARVQQTPVTTSLRDVLSEQLAEQLQVEENPEIVVKATPATREPAPEPHIEASTSNASCETYSNQHVDPFQVESDETDFLLAKLLQEQFDSEYDESVRLQERHLNKNSKIAISLDNYRLTSRAERELLTADDADTASLESSSGEDEPLPSFNRKGICVQGDRIITKHDADVNSKLNVSRMNGFTLAMNTGDSHTFESTKLNNRVFNQLKLASYAIAKRDGRNHERREEQATNVKAVDQRTRLLLFKLVNNGTLQSLDGVVATGKESVILHAMAMRRRRPTAKPRNSGSNQEGAENADADSSDADSETEQPTDVESVAESTSGDGLCECAIKVYKTTLTEFKTRSAYINGDPRFLRDEFKKQNPRKIIRMWAEKEFINLRKLRQCGIPCPEAIELKKHCLLMTFIGSNRIAAPCLRSVELTLDEWRTAYKQLCDTLCVMYQQANLVHGDLSEYNLLWHANRVWIIDVSQSVDRTHPQSWPFLLRDIRNITRFFESRGLKLKRNVKVNDDGNAEDGGAGETTVEGDLDSVETLFNKVTESVLEGEGETWMKAFANYVANARQYKRVTSMLHYGGDSNSTDWREVDADAEDDIEEEIWQFIQNQKNSQK